MSTSVFAAESTTEKAAAGANNAGRSMKKAGHRVSEAVCAENDAKCMAKKAKHRATEGKDYMSDKAKETADKVDADSTPNH